ncbi:4'-phosphopantetheinyl transferase family protein [Kitasatospora azatica]|uniref:4'-phosphopantetheinyl transferase family protein n=1 Tax=Kitasatospora azatica TaxID=58347 RepID=UPI000A541B1F|nr:4'-phosphopantetheinyl transferase superfamily protein [Kitasatospora azatica]
MAAPRLRTLLGRDWDRYLALTHPEVRARFAASRILLKFAAGAAVEVAPEAVELAYHSTGRPYLLGIDAVDISLSHTEELLVVGLSSRGLIGVDAERADRELYGCGLAGHMCTPHELDALESLPVRRRNPELLRLWTLKEAYSKATGLGMRFPFTEFGFGSQGSPQGVRCPDGSPATGADWCFSTCVVDDSYVLSTAVHDSGFGITEDRAAHTMLDETLVDALICALGEEEPERGTDEEW